MKYDLGIWGPIAYDQFSLQGTDIYLNPRLGGCGINQALNFNKLDTAYGKKCSAFLFSSVGRDFYLKRESEGKTRKDALSSLDNITPVLHISDKDTTSFKVLVNQTSKTSKQLDEIINSGRNVNRRLEAIIKSSDQSYSMVGSSIKDLEKRENVIKLLDEIADQYPHIISVAGGTFEMQENVIESIRHYEKSRKKTPSVLFYDPGPVICSLEVHHHDSTQRTKRSLSVLSKVNVLKSNKKENYFLRGGKSEGLFSLLEDTKVIIVTSGKQTNVYINDRNTVRRTDFTGLHTIKTADTTGCGDVFSSSLLWYLCDTAPYGNDLADSILSAIPFAMSVSLHYLSQKMASRQIGIPDYHLHSGTISTLVKNVRKRERKPYNMHK